MRSQRRAGDARQITAGFLFSYQQEGRVLRPNAWAKDG
jgi:hypothetical protein